MGVYYYLVNDTQEKYYHVDGHIKQGPITLNEAVHMGFVNIMFANIGDVFRIISDYDDDVLDNYEQIDLIKSDELDTTIIALMTEKLKKIYKGLYPS